MALAAAPARAASADDVKAAQRKTQEGARQLEDGHAAEALRLFQEAYALTENARYQYNIGVACSALGQDVEALEAFERFAAQARGITREHRRDVEAKMDALKRKVAELEVSASETGVEVRLDGQRLGSTPLAGPIRIKAGAHLIAAAKSGFQAVERKVEVARGSRTRLELVMTPVAAAAVPPPLVPAARAPAFTPPAQSEPRIPVPSRDPEQPEARSTSHFWWWAGAGAAVVVGAAVTVFLVTRGGGSNPMCPPDVESCVR
jgi:hypothetical protein